MLIYDPVEGIVYDDLRTVESTYTRTLANRRQADRSYSCKTSPDARVRHIIPRRNIASPRKTNPEYWYSI